MVDEVVVDDVVVELVVVVSSSAAAGELDGGASVPDGFVVAGIVVVGFVVDGIVVAGIVVGAVVAVVVGAAVADGEVASISMSVVAGRSVLLDCTAELHAVPTRASASTIDVRVTRISPTVAPQPLRWTSPPSPDRVIQALPCRRVSTVGRMIDGWRCAVCDTAVPVDAPLVWQCPNRTAADPYHVLHLVASGARPAPVDDPNPFVRFGPRLAWWALAGALGLSVDQRRALTDEVTHGFTVTPFTASSVLSSELGVQVWVKDETPQVAGSQKGRHLASILLHLRAAEVAGVLTERRSLAIASCGNAAMAAATLAARVEWPLDVFVPTWMDPAFGRRLDELGARTHPCERRAGDPPGDPAMLRFREAVAAGAIPFSVQGPENAWCLDGGRTMGWEILEQADAAGIALDRAFIQVGGGAFAASVGAGLGPDVRLDLVQTEGCAPLAAAWRRAGVLDDPPRHWAEVMQPWPDPQSAADGILDDETYDWVADLDVMRASGGRPIVATEHEVLAAHDLASRAGFAVSVTGSAGLAGALHVRDEFAADDHVAVVMSGASRD